MFVCEATGGAANLASVKQRKKNRFAEVWWVFVPRNLLSERWVMNEGRLSVGVSFVGSNVENQTDKSA